MQPNIACVNLIKEFEGCKLTAYPDQGGRYTIGWGTAAPWVTEGMTCTQQQADAWLMQDVQNVAAALSRMIKVIVNENKFSALVSWAYNCGLGNAANSSLIARLNEGHPEEVPAQLERWNKVGGVIDAGLVRRRAAEVALWDTPVTADA